MVPALAGRCMDGAFWLSCSLPAPLGFAQRKLKRVFHLCNLQLQPRLEGQQESPYPHPRSPRLGDNSKREKLEKYVAIVLNPSFAMRIDPLGHPHPLHAVGTAISPRKTALTLTRGEHIHSAQHSACPGSILAMIQTATGVLKTVTAILSSPEQN